MLNMTRKKLAGMGLIRRRPTLKHDAINFSTF